MPPTIAELLAFWFEEAGPDRWFASSGEFDQACGRFADAVADARSGQLDDWQSSAEGSLALCLLLDQLPRNLFRGTPGAFASDPAARAVADRAVSRGHDLTLPEDRRLFLYMPFQHSESLDDQRRAVRLIAERTPSNPDVVDYACLHLSIIRWFGRFPHRNAVLGRTNTPEEAIFLTLPQSGF